jgi:hypothetical protein
LHESGECPRGGFGQHPTKVAPSSAMQAASNGALASSLWRLADQS